MGNWTTEEMGTISSRDGVWGEKGSDGPRVGQGGGASFPQPLMKMGPRAEKREVESETEKKRTRTGDDENGTAWTEDKANS